MKKATVLQVGDTVSNRLTQQQGRIVRIVKMSEIQQTTSPRQRDDLGYIVSLSETKEALWQQNDITG
ncbi:MAG: hypothetical protein WB919_01055 [Candidatus Sulfotelmatobacter sp.]